MKYIFCFLLGCFVSGFGVHFVESKMIQELFADLTISQYKLVYVTNLAIEEDDLSRLEPFYEDALLKYGEDLRELEGKVLRDSIRTKIHQVLAEFPYESSKL